MRRSACAWRISGLHTCALQSCAEYQRVRRTHRRTEVRPSCGEGIGRACYCLWLGRHCSGWRWLRIRAFGSGSSLCAKQKNDGPTELTVELARSGGLTLTSSWRTIESQERAAPLDWVTLTRRGIGRTRGPDDVRGAATARSTRKSGYPACRPPCAGIDSLSPRTAAARTGTIHPAGRHDRGRIPGRSFST
jgi:hypothetical protein